GPNSASLSVECLCNHLTSFGGSVFVAPNPIDFDVVLLELGRLDQTGNVAVLSTILVFLLLYAVIAVFAWRADRRDKRKVMENPLSENGMGSTVQYEMTVFTGVWRNSGTTANVAIVIHGSEATSEPVVLSPNMSPSRIALASGNADQFVISMASPLGSIEYLNVLHDNTGPSPAWFLNKIIIKDTQNDQQWIFMCNDWIAIDKGSGRINRIILPTSPEEMKTF
ncbi:predicted protein, partial [Nematostella vectensis]